MVFGLAFEILEDALFPVLFHEIPVTDETVPNRILDRVARGRLSLVAYVEVKIVEATRLPNTHSFFYRNRFENKQTSNNYY